MIPAPVVVYAVVSAGRNGVMAAHFVGSLSTPAASPSVRAQVWKWAGGGVPPAMARGTGWQLRASVEADQTRLAPAITHLTATAMPATEFGVVAEAVQWRQYGGVWAASVAVTTIGTDVVFQPTCADGLPQPPGSPVWAVATNDQCQLKFVIGGPAAGGLIGYLSFACNTDDCEALVYFVRPAAWARAAAPIYFASRSLEKRPRASVSDLFTSGVPLQGTLGNAASRLRPSIQKQATRATEAAAKALGLCRKAQRFQNAGALGKVFENAQRAHTALAATPTLNASVAATHHNLIETAETEVAQLTGGTNIAVVSKQLSEAVVYWEAECVKLKELLQQAKRKLVVIEEANKELRAEVVALEDKVAEQEDASRSQQRQFEEQKQAAEDEADELLSAEKAKVAGLKSENDALEVELAGADALNDQLTAKLKGKEEALRDADEAADEHDAEAALMKVQISALNEKIQEQNVSPPQTGVKSSRAPRKRAASGRRYTPADLLEISTGTSAHGESIKELLAGPQAGSIGVLSD